MNDYVDLHTHTIASGHAYSTIEAMIKAAEQKGIRLFGITEHAPKMPGTCSELYFNNLRVLERKHGEMYTLFGAELNIMDMEGHVDLPERTLKQMDLCVASMHGPCFHPGTIEENTKTYLNVMKNPYVNIIGSQDPKEHNGIVNFTVEGVHPHDIASILDGAGVDVRAGHHCAQPLLKHLGVFVTTRASIAFYNDEEDIHRFTEAVKGIRRMMGYAE